MIQIYTCKKCCILVFYTKHCKTFVQDKEVKPFFFFFLNLLYLVKPLCKGFNPPSHLFCLFKSPAAFPDLKQLPWPILSLFHSFLLIRFSSNQLIAKDCEVGPQPMRKRHSSHHCVRIKTQCPSPPAPPPSGLGPPLCEHCTILTGGEAVPFSDWK